MSEERVQIEIADHVAVVTMVRGDKHNALDIPMFEGLVDASTQLATTPGVRAIVLHGAGPSFCSGLDIASVLTAQSNGTAPMDPLEGPTPNFFQRTAYGWTEVPMPVIAAIHGNCLGGGLQIALGADIRIATPDARLSVMESKWGLIPDMAITRSLPRLVGIDIAKELAYTARIVSGEEALALGLVTHLSDDPLAAARELAAEIASKSPDAIRRAKRLFEEAWTGTPDETLGLEAKLQLELMGTPNQIAAVTAGMTKQPGEFVDPS